MDALNVASAALARAGFRDSTLVLRWPDIAGPDVARVAEPLKYQEGPNGAVLTLKCEPGASVFLQHETRALIGRLNAYLGPGRIARIRLTPGTLVPLPDVPNHPGRVPPLADSPDASPLARALNRLEQLRRNLQTTRRR